MKVVVAPHHEFFRVDHRRVREDLADTRGRGETDHELMLCDLVRVSAPCNFKTIHFYYRTRLQIRTVVTRSISGNEPVNNRVLQGNLKIKILELFNQKKKRKASRSIIQKSVPVHRGIEILEHFNKKKNGKLEDL